MSRYVHYLFVLLLGTILSTCSSTAQTSGKLSPLSAQGKWLVNAEGDRISLYGANIWTFRGTETSDSIEDLRKNIDILSDRQSGLGYANFMRLAVHSINICDDVKMQEHVDTYVAEAVRYAGERGLYILIEPHYFPGDDNQYVPCDDDQEENYITNGWWLEKIKTFWDYAAPKFKDEPHVLYAVTNEPVRPETCEDIHSFMQELVDYIRPLAPERLISVQSYTWTNNADCWVDPQFQIDDDNILYEAHIYPWNPDNKGGDPQIWTDRIGRAAEVVPVLIGEFGYEDANDPVQWRESIKQWMSGYPNMSWAAWCLDCGSSMEIIECNRTITGWGEFLGNWMRETYESP